MTRTKKAAPAPPHETNGHAAPPELVELELRLIVPSPTNPRRRLDEAALAELADSIRTQGVLQPLLVRPRPDGGARPGYELVCGERRWRAAKLAGVATVPCVVRQLGDREVIEAQVVENEQRADVTPLERAEGYAALVREHGVSVEDLAARVGKSVSTIRGLIRLLDLPEKARQAVEDGTLPAATAQLIARVPNQMLREQFAETVLNPPGHYMQQADGVLTYRGAKEELERTYMVELKGAPFSRNDGKLLPDAGPCHLCPKLAGNLIKVEPEVYKGLRADVCTDPGCYRIKVAAQQRRGREQAERKGLVCLDEAECERIFGPNGGVTSWHWLDLNYPCPEFDNRRKWSEALEGLSVTRYFAYDPAGKPYTLAKSKEATRALVNAGLINDPDGPGKRKPPGLVSKSGGPTPEQLAEDLGGGVRAPAPPVPGRRQCTEYDVRRKARDLAVGIIGEVAQEGAEDLDGLETHGGAAGWLQALRLAVMGYVVWLEQEFPRELGLLEQRMTLLDRSVDETDGRPLTGYRLWRAWADRVKPSQLLAFLAQAGGLELLSAYEHTAIEYLDDELDIDAREAGEVALDFAELDWAQLNEQARRELAGGKKAEVPEE